MRFIHFYLIAYFALIAGAALALWRAGVFTRIPPGWLVLAALIAVGLGVLLAAITVRPVTATRN